MEWGRFVRLAEAEARTAPGRAILARLDDPAHWAADVGTARILQQETQEVTSLLDRDALWGPLIELADPEPALERLARGSVLELIELVQLRAWLYAIDSWSQVPRDEIRGERFKRMLNALPDPFQPLRVLERVLTPDGELSERASPKLAQLHAEIRVVKREIGSTLDQVVKQYSAKGVLQESFSDVRDGRYVIPVRISAQHEVEGTVYEASASRQTVFVEPSEISPLNNRLRKLQNDLIQEIYRVLEETSKQVRPFADEIRAGAGALAHWDSTAAKARLGRHFSGKPIQVGEDREFRLQQTAHPLLWWSLKPEQIIRNEVDFGDPVRTLLLTGPNTGGKTVLLKTLGMAGICARTGFPFPATDNPCVPFFDTFFADLGDPQSIEQHLSSFSGHIARFREILEQVTQSSLVLLDELNAATDPEEGAALGRAFLETVMGRGAMTVATTHDPHLKALAVADGRILNASMAFDENARTPTYTIVLGVPGRSRALETAERLGLPADVLELARSYLSREHLEFEAMLSRLQNDAETAARARKEAVAAREEAEKMKREWTERTTTSVNEMLERTRQKLRRILEQAQDEVRSSVRKLDEMKSRREVDVARAGLAGAFSKSAAKIETALGEEAPELAETLSIEKLEPAELPPAAKIEVGVTVRVPKWKSLGTVVEMMGQKAKVKMGTIQMTLALGDIEALSPEEIAKIHPQQRAAASPAKSRTVITDQDRPAAPARSLDLRGTRFEEAMGALERYLDQAYRSGALAEVTIVHGLGTGALREGARKLLSELPYVKEYRDGGVGMGGAGATIVEFER